MNGPLMIFSSSFVVVVVIVKELDKHLLHSTAALRVVFAFAAVHKKYYN